MIVIDEQVFWLKVTMDKTMFVHEVDASYCLNKEPEGLVLCQTSPLGYLEE